MREARNEGFRDTSQEKGREMSQSFNLLDEHWIPVLWHDGKYGKVGIKEALESAGSILEITAASPLVQFSIQRLLLAVVHWLSPMADEGLWRATWKSGRLPSDLLRRLREIDAGRFDLFHVNYPFYQTRADGKTKSKSKPSSVGKLFPEIPTVTYKNHFFHAYDKSTVLCPACCAQGLIMLPPFCTGVGAGNEASINGAPPLYLMPEGANLFQTLLLNLPVYGTVPSWDPSGKPDDTPAWQGFPAEDGVIGFLEGITWQPRHVRLIPVAVDGGRCSFCGGGSSILVRDMHFAQGRTRFVKSREGKRVGNRPWLDPHAAMKKDKEVRRPITPPESGLEYWHVKARCILSMDSAPPMIEQVRKLLLHPDFPELQGLQVSCISFTTSKAEFLSVERDEWFLCPQYFMNPDLRGEFNTMLDVAEKLSNALKRHITSDEMAMFEKKAEAAFRTALVCAPFPEGSNASRIEIWKKELLKQALSSASALPLPPGSPKYFQERIEKQAKLQKTIRRLL